MILKFNLRYKNASAQQAVTFTGADDADTENYY